MFEEQLEQDLNVVEHYFYQDAYVYRLMFLSNPDETKVVFLKGLYDYKNPLSAPLETTLLTSKDMDGIEVFTKGARFIQEIKKDLAGKAEYSWAEHPVYFTDDSQMSTLEAKITRTVGFYYKNEVLKFFRDQTKRNNPNWGAWA